MMDGFGGMWFGWIFWIALIAVVIWVLLKVSNNANKKYPSLPNKETPLEVLKRRYASGEITKADFEDMKEDLK